MIGDIIDLFKEVKEIAEKHNNAEVMEKLTRLYGVITEIQEENERLEKRVKELESLHLTNDDIEIHEKGYYFRKSEVNSGKNIRYCAACYANYSKLYPFVSPSVGRNLICSNCKLSIR